VTPIPLTVFCLLLAGQAAVAAENWQALKGKHFIVRHRGDDAMAGRVLRMAEGYYRSIAIDLGFTKYDDFWLWDKRVRIQIHHSRKDFTRATGAPPWAAGKANYQSRQIDTFNGSEEFLDSVLPHELTHLVFRDFVGFDSGIPLWLDEGVAQWEERAQRKPRMALARSLMLRNRLLPLTTLTAIDVRTVEDDGLVAHFYIQSMSVVGFLITEHGSLRFRKLCGQLRDGKSLDEALRFTYPDTIRTITELEQGWQEYLEAAR